MRLLKRLAGLLGIAKENASSAATSSSTTSPPFAVSEDVHHNPKGFTLPLHRPPILVPCTSIQAGVQGLRWFARRLKIDEDGDVADEFFEDVVPDRQESMEVDHIPVTNIEVKYIVRPAKVRNQMISPDGKLQHCVENQGRLQWV